jgi:hypothetical protein
MQMTGTLFAHLPSSFYKYLPCILFTFVVVAFAHILRPNYGRVAMDLRALPTVPAFCCLLLRHVGIQGDLHIRFAFHLKRLALTHFLLCRACALLGSLECVHGAVDKGISLLEQAAAKVHCQSMCAMRDLLTRPLPQGVCDAHLELGLHFHAKDPKARGGGGLTNAEQVCTWVPLMLAGFWY